jgi:hypothetical protein
MLTAVRANHMVKISGWTIKAFARTVDRLCNQTIIRLVDWGFPSAGGFRYIFETMPCLRPDLGMFYLEQNATDIKV